MQGRRLPDTPMGELPDGFDTPGAYWKCLKRDGSGEPLTAGEALPNDPRVAENLTGTVWGYCPPKGLGIGMLQIHTVRENDDGTISVLPGDGSSNSILHDDGRGTVWHGYIYNGEWREA